MKKIILISYDASIENNILVDRIKRVGESRYPFLKSSWLILTEDSPKELYNKIIGTEFSEKSFFVTEIKSNPSNYWGLMDRELWDWIERVDKLIE